MPSLKLIWRWFEARECAQVGCDTSNWQAQGHSNRDHWSCSQSQQLHSPPDDQPASGLLPLVGGSDALLLWKGSKFTKSSFFLFKKISQKFMNTGRSPRGITPCFLSFFLRKQAGVCLDALGCPGSCGGTGRLAAQWLQAKRTQISWFFLRSNIIFPRSIRRNFTLKPIRFERFSASKALCDCNDLCLCR